MKVFTDENTGPPSIWYSNTLIFYLFGPNLKHFVSQYVAAKRGNPLITDYLKMQGSLHYAFAQRESKETSSPRFLACVSPDSEKHFYFCIKLIIGHFSWLPDSGT